MVEGKVSARAVALQDLMRDLNVLDKKEISLGVLQLSINEQTKRTLEKEIEQKHRMQIEQYKNNENININIESNAEKTFKEEEEKKDKDKNKNKNKTMDDGANDLII